MTAPITMKVERILSQRYGGVIFAGRTVPDDRRMRVRAGAKLVGTAPVVDEMWVVRGSPSARFADQIEAEALWRVRPAGRLVAHWIAAKVEGIGKARAQRLAERFGDQLEAVLDDDDPQPLAAVLAPDRPNLGSRLACACLSAWRDLAVEAKVHAWLDRYGNDDPLVGRRVCALFGDEAIDILAENPYSLTNLLPWPKVDSLGKRLLTEFAESEDFDARRDPRRLVGIVDSLMKGAISAGGHTAVPKADLRSRVADRLADIPPRERNAVVEETLRLAILNRAVIDGGDVWRVPGCAFLEEELAAKLRVLIGGPWCSAVRRPTEATLRALLARLKGEEGIHLHPEQRDACAALLRAPVSCLIGGAGVGKTTTLRALCAAWEALGGRVVLCALAGKAALRISQATHRLARTIHRTLVDLREIRTSGCLKGARQGNNGAYLDNATLLIVDEASMVDLCQLHELVDHMPEGCHLLLVGDPAQLPPVGPGLVFHRLAEVATITARLETIHRQTEATGIPIVARAVRDGVVPPLKLFNPTAPEGVSFVPAGGTKMLDAIDCVVDQLGGFGETGHDLQIISATNDSHSCSVRPLNRLFHDRRMRAAGLADDADLVGPFGDRFVAGDPVVFTRNVYLEGLFNGLLGRVLEVNPLTETLQAEFDGVVHSMDTERLMDLQLAYAISAHKAQGSSAKAVIVPVYKAWVMDRTWVYTAITRAEEICVLVGDADVFTVAITAPPAPDRRRTCFSLL